ncbi:MAG: protease SohB [Gammaproteobacteria bacterium]|nr:protease SohB [Gammaproteobacteria bacterium]MDH5727732.1 protease SohB [Gammaproteobacteria bacterium]
MAFLAEYGMFFLKTITIVVAIIMVALGLFSVGARGRDERSSRIQLKKLNQYYDDMTFEIQQELAPRKQQKKLLKAQKNKLKHEGKVEKNESRVFVIEFHGDLRASAVSHLREEITAILLVANENDEVFVKVESPGGVVFGYGLAASQLQRIRDKNIRLTISVDKVAASGGYMMACVADHIIAAPFAIVGSIGVVAEMPNINRFLKKHDVDIELHTAGEYKRTLTVLGENTDKAREKFRQDLQDVHDSFKEFIQHNRPNLDVEKVATGEHWLASRALDLGLVDELKTSDDYLLAKKDEAEIIQIKHSKKRRLAEIINDQAAKLFSAKKMLDDNPYNYLR